MVAAPGTPNPSSQLDLSGQTRHCGALNLERVLPMPRRLISTGSPFEKTAGYSRAVVDGDFVFVSGTTGYDYATMTLPEDVTAQTRNCFKTIGAALKEAGFEMADIVRATYYVTDPKYADAVFAVCGENLSEIRPAATIVAVAGLFKPEMKIEIEVTAKRRTD
jgi:enamine deaminase RidA (YjgF/YER057c/UK114 family)